MSLNNTSIGLYEAPSCTALSLAGRDSVLQSLSLLGDYGNSGDAASGFGGEGGGDIINIEDTF